MQNVFIFSLKNAFYARTSRFLIPNSTKGGHNHLPGQLSGKMHKPVELESKYPGLHSHPIARHILLQGNSFGESQVEGHGLGQRLTVALKSPLQATSAGIV